MTITDLDPGDQETVRAVAELLVAAFAHVPGCMKTVVAALGEVRESFGPGRISRVARDDDGTVSGWIAGIEQYHGYAWELHPLAVKPGVQRRGIGRALVSDLEEQVRRRGASVLYLGCDDEFAGTSLYGADLLPDVFRHVAAIRNVGRHPFEFYQKCGYVIVGVLPDVNGPGRPDILMAKRI